MPTEDADEAPKPVITAIDPPRAPEAAPAVEMRSLDGLSSAEASRRLRSEGYNELASSKPRSIL